jgi:hypothetical protein
MEDITPCVTFPGQGGMVFDMTSWRMQLHPNTAGESARLAAESLSRGFIGLDFTADVGDLMRVLKRDLTPVEKIYWMFAHEMQEGDFVLIYVHNYPFALARVAGPYNYIKTPVPQIGVWFRHFRKVDQVHYYSDFITNPKNWEASVMPATITPLRNVDTQSQQLLNEWIAAAGLAGL